MNVYLNKRNFILPKILAGIIALFLLVAVLNLFQKPFKNFFYFISSPAQKYFLGAGNSASGLVWSFLNAVQLSAKNFQLQSENQKLLAQVASLQDSLRTKEALTGMSANNPQNDLQVVLVNTIGFDSVQDSILLDRGSDDGILENMPVIDSEKVLYGKVVAVYKNYSKAMLISDESSIVNVKIQDSDIAKPPIYGAVKGSGNRSCYLDLVPNESEINSGQVLVTSALEGVFPKDLLVGKITAPSKNDQRPFQTAKIEPFFNMQKDGKLFIITNYKSEK